MNSILPRNTPLKRTAVKKKRSKPRPGRVKGADLYKLRVDCWLRDKEACQQCGIHTLFYAPHWWDNSYHMAHIKVKRMGGDSLENVRTLCGKCHRIEHNYGPSGVKPCPSKSDGSAYLATISEDACL